ncbi:hypothetical protein M6D81_09035 [Paenibacillus sp. J5C_2022]|uniref:hypothetical protein n=1 Tax=Paenibacillus sp. J5C2022 TaxID=2977129 RepID=UPI0021D1A256|nr:hypothetical protein [Paenibacillus sp. J5C2022]MCU6708864.1 hypothetical protein [Paenibacillus sp. J5C2022]
MLEIVFGDVEINVTPLEDIKMNTTDISIEFDDSDEVRWRASFCPYQAFKVTTIDCIETESFMTNGKRPFHILKVTHSDWLNELKLTLANKDASANFLDKAHHYVFPFQDIIIEVVGWELNLEKL